MYMHWHAKLCMHAKLSPHAIYIYATCQAWWTLNCSKVLGNKVLQLCHTVWHSVINNSLWYGLLALNVAQWVRIYITFSSVESFDACKLDVDFSTSWNYQNSPIWKRLAVERANRRAAVDIATRCTEVEGSDPENIPIIILADLTVDDLSSVWILSFNRPTPKPDVVGLSFSWSFLGGGISPFVVVCTHAARCMHALHTYLVHARAH